MLFVKKGLSEIHFFPVVNFDLFVTPKRSNTNKRKSAKKFYCFNCFYPLNSAENRRLHYAQCIKDHVPQVHNFPGGDGDVPPKMKFKAFNKKFKQGIVGYCDMESSLYQKMCSECPECSECLCVCDNSCTIKTKTHHPLRFLFSMRSQNILPNWFLMTLHLYCHMRPIVNMNVSIATVWFLWTVMGVLSSNVLIAGILPSTIFWWL